MKPIAIFHEHPDWFRPLFAALDRREIPYVRVSAATHSFDPDERESPYSLVFNRASPSAHTRGHFGSIFHTGAWLEHLERMGVPVVNGSHAYALEISKARQLGLIRASGARHPRSRVINSPRLAPEAARDLRFPVIVKANIGGSGAGITRFDSLAALGAAVEMKNLELGVDGTALVQELAPLRDGCIQRIELLGGKLLYAIRIYPDDSFNLCPADACRTTSGAELARGACALDAPKNGMRVEAFTPTRDVADIAERIARKARLDVGGIEYLIDDRDGEPSFYDVNALSNFVADPVRVVGFDPFETLVDYLVARIGSGEGESVMRFGYWLPVFGGWLRNVEDERMEASWQYAKCLAQRSERIGYDLTLVAELFLNDIKGHAAPALEAWSTAAALAAVTDTLEIMVAVRPTFHSPAVLAKQAANIDRIANGRLSLNVVSSWWSDEARRYGVRFDQHDDRYARTAEWLEVVNGAWSESSFSFSGRHYQVADLVVEPKPQRRPRPTLYAGGESEAARDLIARSCDAYVMHGDPLERVATKIADMRRRRAEAELPPLTFGMAAYVVVRETEEAARREVARITDVSPTSPGYGNYQDWLANTQLDQRVSLEDYSVSNRGLRAALVGTPAQVIERISRLEAAGLNLLLIQCSPQLEEMDRIAETVIQPMRGSRATLPGTAVSTWSAA